MVKASKAKKTPVTRSQSAPEKVARGCQKERFTCFAPPRTVLRAAKLGFSGTAARELAVGCRAGLGAALPDAAPEEEGVAAASAIAATVLAA